MVYAFFLIGTLVMGVVYWLTSSCNDEAAKDLMWSPGSGLIEPESWLTSGDGGYTGWSPGSSNTYAGWSPSAYLNLFTPTTIFVPTTRTTTKRTRRTRRTRLPPALPHEVSDEVIPPPSPSEDDLGPVIPPPSSVSETSPEEDLIPPSDTEPSFDENRKPPGGEPPPPPATDPPPTTLSPIEAYYEYGFRRFWKSKDENEEAYEENPQDLLNTRPPDKLPVEGWGYDYDNTV